MSYVYMPNSLHVAQLQKKIQQKILNELQSWLKPVGVDTEISTRWLDY